MNKPHTVVMGLGNLVFTDEGLGVHAVQHLWNHYELPEELEVIDGGTLGLLLLDPLERARRALIIDAVDVAKAPGTFVILKGEEIPAYMGVKMSQHQQGFQEVMALAKLRGAFPDELVLIGVQPEHLDWGLELTPTVAGVFPKVIAAAIEQLQLWGYKILPKS